MSRKRIVRRDVLKGALVGSGSALVAGSISFIGCRSAPPSVPAAKAPTPTVKATVRPRLSATDQVTLGRTGIKMSRLGFGTGTASGDNQRRLGRDNFINLMRYAFERGITYIDTADAYKTHDLVAEAIKGLPREKFFILSKMPGTPEDPVAELDRYRRELRVDYLDLLLVHCATTPRWDDDRKRVTDTLLEAQHRQIIRARGVSCHGLPALTRSTATEFPEAHLVRINPSGTRMDGPTKSDDVPVPEHVDRVKTEMRKMREMGRGVIGMKIMGDGVWKTDAEREQSVKFVMQSGLVDAINIGFEKAREIDWAIEHVDKALAEAT
jgi:hypothetical protein